jgi:hypothetical protein
MFGSCPLRATRLLLAILLLDSPVHQHRKVRHSAVDAKLYAKWVLLAQSCSDIIVPIWSCAMGWHMRNAVLQGSGIATGYFDGAVNSTTYRCDGNKVAPVFSLPLTGKPPAMGEWSLVLRLLIPMVLRHRNSQA